MQSRNTVSGTWSVRVNSNPHSFWALEIDIKVSENLARFEIEKSEDEEYKKLRYERLSSALTLFCSAIDVISEQYSSNDEEDLQAFHRQSLPATVSTLNTPKTPTSVFSQMSGIQPALPEKAANSQKRSQPSSLYQPMRNNFVHDLTPDNGENPVNQRPARKPGQSNHGACCRIL